MFNSFFFQKSCHLLDKGKDKVFLLQARCGPEGG